MDLIEALHQSGVDTEGTLSRFSGNAALLERFVRKFPQDATFGQLREAVVSKDFAAVEVAAHTLKGVTANLGFQRLSALSAAMVKAVREGRTEELEALLEPVAEEYQMLVALISEAE